MPSRHGREFGPQGPQRRQVYPMRGPLPVGGFRPDMGLFPVNGSGPETPPGPWGPPTSERDLPPENGHGCFIWAEQVIDGTRRYQLQPDVLLPSRQPWAIIARQLPASLTCSPASTCVFSPSTNASALVSSSRSATTSTAPSSLVSTCATLPNSTANGSHSSPSAPPHSLVLAIHPGRSA